MSDYPINNHIFSISKAPETIEPLRLRVLKAGPPRPLGRYVLYWMQINRRADHNPALSHAILEANRLRLPLVVYEGLRADYPFANDRIHSFVLEGAFERHQALRARGIRPCFYLQLSPSDHRDTVKRLCQDAALLVTDNFPTFIISQQNQRIVETTDLPVTAVDASTIVPLLAFTKAEYAARTLRPKIHRLLPHYLTRPLEPVLEHQAPTLPLPIDWETDLTTPVPALVAACQIDHDVHPSPIFRGGTLEARKRLQTFLKLRINTYDTARNSPALRGTSELSPYLHFGMISPLEVALAVLESNASEDQMGPFLEELIVRRELAFNFCAFNPLHRTLQGLPDWAQKTLAQHDNDPRAGIWSPEQIEQAKTPDPVWNLAQRELLVTGKIQGYIRMLWGKKILEHTPTHAQAHALMVSLHDKYALDGRDPNTYTNILWCLGLHDRAWGPAKPVIGLIRPMSSEAMRKKTDLNAYKRWIDFAEAQGKQ